VFQFPPISINFAQPLKRSGRTFHTPLSAAWSILCKGNVALHEANGGHQIWTFWSTALPFKVSVTNICVSVLSVMWNT
jgi:hypothetical protein